MRRWRLHWQLTTTSICIGWKTNGIGWDKTSPVFTFTFYYGNKIEIRKAKKEKKNEIHQKPQFEWMVSQDTKRQNENVNI